MDRPPGTPVSILGFVANSFRADRGRPALRGVASPATPATYPTSAGIPGSRPVALPTPSTNRPLMATACRWRARFPGEAFVLVVCSGCFSDLPFFFFFFVFMFCQSPPLPSPPPLVDPTFLLLPLRLAPPLGGLFFDDRFLPSSSHPLRDSQHY